MKTQTKRKTGRGKELQRKKDEGEMRTLEMKEKGQTARWRQRGEGIMTRRTRNKNGMQMNVMH